MADKYPSTLLVEDDPKKVDINKAILDLLKKINETANSASTGTAASSPVWIQGLLVNTIDTGSVSLSSGGCSNLAGTSSVTITSPLTGSLQGQLDSGSIATGTWYAVFLIWGTGGAPRVLFSTSSINPGLPKSYSSYRRVGWVYTDGSKNLFGLTNFPNNYVEWKPFNNSFSASQDATTTRNVSTMLAPPNTLASCGVCLENFVSGDMRMWLRSTSFTDVAASAITCELMASTGGFATGSAQVPVDGNRQIAWRKTYTADVYIWVRGWMDDRTT